MIKLRYLLLITNYLPILGIDYAWLASNKNSISIILDQGDLPTHVVKEFKDEADSPEFFINEVLGSKLAQEAGILTPGLEILPFLEDTKHKKTHHFGIKTNFIAHKRHSCSLNVIEDPVEYLKGLKAHPALLDILAFDIVTKNIDRRSPNILYVPHGKSQPDWYAIDHEWIFSDNQAPSVYMLTHELIRQLNSCGNDTGVYQPLIEGRVNSDHERWVKPKMFEKHTQKAITLAALLSEPVARMLPLLHADKIKEAAKDAFKNSGVFCPEIFKGLDLKIEYSSMNAQLFARLFDESRSLKDDEQLLEQTASLSSKKDL
jgi:hypothetical protein